MAQQYFHTPFPPWTTGTLDIHHIDTGCGSCTFILGPDGTTILIDCGEDDSVKHSAAGATRAGHRVVHYIKRHGANRTNGAISALDYIIATHVHPDHVSGLRDVDEILPAAKVIDRGYPDYKEPVNVPLLPLPFAKDYIAWLDELQQTRPGTVETIDVGSDSQIRLTNAVRGEYPTFSMRTIAGNGCVWTGVETKSVQYLSDETYDAVEDHVRPDENKCSMAFLLSYGNFRYYTGGDLTFDTYDGRHPWLDIETPVAQAAGCVDVAVANHHGYFDACGPLFVEHLDADAYIIPAWHDTHPGMAQLQRLLGDWPGGGHKKTKVFATGMTATSNRINERFLRVRAVSEQKQREAG
ncbi:hypothetical protein SEUCBS139899_004934 [Sporothrix eucalyptigena]